MDAELIERFAKEAGFIFTTADDPPSWGVDAGTFVASAEPQIQRLISLVAEECAKVCDESAAQRPHPRGQGARSCAAAIRERFKQ